MISVCIPTFNRAHFLAETIDSVLAQSLTNFELIIVDDASTDSTPDLLHYYAEKDSRVTFLRNTHNLGIAESRNRAIKACNGGYIAMMDDDDLMTTYRLELSLKTLEESGADIVYSDFIEADQEGNTTLWVNGEATLHIFSMDKPIEDPSITLENVLKDQIVPQPTVMATKETWLSVPYRYQKDGMDDDHYVIASWYKQGRKFKKMKEPVLIKRFHSENHYTLFKDAYNTNSKTLSEEL